MVEDALRRHDLFGHEICIEITEGVFVDHSEKRIESVLAAVGELGVASARKTPRAAMQRIVLGF